jgi:glucose-6-phosphate isomerase
MGFEKKRSRWNASRHGLAAQQSLMENIQFKYEESSGVAREEIEKTFNALVDYRQKLQETSKELGYKTAESSIALSFDQEMHARIGALALKFKNPALTYVIHVGIGGSSLGTQAIYEALFGNLDPFLRARVPKIIFADTVNPDTINVIRTELWNLTAPEEVALVVVSKSGGTTETAANFEVIYQLLKDKWGEVKQRVAVVTDENSKLWTGAQAQGFSVFPIPQTVGGRFSVLSAAGLLSLSLVGIDTDAVRQGASIMAERCFSDNLDENIAALSASIIYLHHQKGISIHNSFFFNPKLESLGKWYRQLVGESLGKEDNRTGERVSTGITPIVSIGSNDLHSVAQLYLGGPNDKFTTFVNAFAGEPVMIPDSPVLPGLVGGIAGKNFEYIANAIYRGVRSAYAKRKLPFVEIMLPEISPKTLGAYMQFKMVEIMYLARLLGVNAFDQPNVEEYKAKTRQILES